MTFTETMDTFLNRIMTSDPSLLLGLPILLAGYLVAKLSSTVVRQVVARSSLDARTSELLALRPPLGPQSVQSTIGRITFWVIMLLALVGFFSQFGLPLVAEPLRSMMRRLTVATPNLLEAALILLVAWVVATGLRFVVVKALMRFEVDRRFGRHLVGQPPGLSQTLGMLTFYAVLLVAVPPFLAALGRVGVVDPLMQMLRLVLSYLPNVAAAALTIGVGWVVAWILREVVRNLLAATGLDRTIERAGLVKPLGEIRLSGFIGTVVYFVVWVPFIVAGLDDLKIQAVSGPAVSALNGLLAWVPKGLGALGIVLLAWIISHLVRNLIAQLFRGIGFDSLAARIGLPTSGGRTLSDLAGLVAAAFIMLFALIEAFKVMEFAPLAAFGDRLLAFVVNVVIAAAVVGVGLWVGNFVQNLLQEALQRAGSRHSKLIGVAAKFTVGIFAFFMAFQQLGFGETIGSTASTLILGAVCLAVALAFGLGSRDVAARMVDRAVGEEWDRGR